LKSSGLLWDNGHEESLKQREQLKEKGSNHKQKILRGWLRGAANLRSIFIIARVCPLHKWKALNYKKMRFL
jgi:hypothetical protein